MELKESAEREFRSNYMATIENMEDESGFNKAVFDRWWKAHEKQAARLNYDGAVSFVDLSAIDHAQPDHGPSLLKTSLDISKRGRVSRLRARKIPWPKLRAH